MLSKFPCFPTVTLLTERFFLVNPLAFTRLFASLVFRVAGLFNDIVHAKDLPERNALLAGYLTVQK